MHTLNNKGNQNESLFVADDWAIFLWKWTRRGHYSQWQVLSVNVEWIFVYKNWRGGYWQHLVSIGRRYVTHSRSYTCCFAPRAWRSHYRTLAFRLICQHTRSTRARRLQWSEGRYYWEDDNLLTVNLPCFECLIRTDESNLRNCKHNGQPNSSQQQQALKICLLWITDVTNNKNIRKSKHLMF